MKTTNVGKPRAVTPYVGTFSGTLTTRGDCKFDPSQDVWELEELTFSKTIRLDDLPHLSETFRNGFRAALAWYAQNYSLHHLSNMYEQSRKLFSFKANTFGSPVEDITHIDILNYKAHIGKAREWYLGSLSGFLKKWQALGYAGVSTSAVTLLRQLRLKGNAKGRATATRDPIRGPFTSIEFEALQQAFNNAYASGNVNLDDYVLGWLFMALGMRPSQYAALKVCDVAPVHVSAGVATYSIRMPRGKVRGSPPRSQFKDRVLSPQLGPLVTRYAAQVGAVFATLLEDPSQAPLFPTKEPVTSRNPNAFHQNAGDLGKTLTSVFKGLRVISERTGKPLTFTTRRFRRTIGTRAAEEGHGELVIAELLDHSDTQNVGVYVTSTPIMLDRIDRAIAMQLAPLAQAFMGKLIDGPSAASRNGEPTSLIRAPIITNEYAAMSSCGKDGFCGFLKPIACYTCNSFEPWLDGPHEKVLTWLLAERERLASTTDSRIAAVNDRTILAVAEVIRRCELARSEQA